MDSGEGGVSRPKTFRMEGLAESTDCICCAHRDRRFARYEFLFLQMFEHVMLLMGCLKDEESYSIRNFKRMLHRKGLLPADIHLKSCVEVVVYHHLLEKTRLFEEVCCLRAFWKSRIQMMACTAAIISATFTGDLILLLICRAPHRSKITVGL